MPRVVPEPGRLGGSEAHPSWPYKKCQDTKFQSPKSPMLLEPGGFAPVSSYCLAALDVYKKVHPDRM